jgi:probable rRNA maturation factor
MTVRMSESAITIAIESPCAQWADEADLRDLVVHTLAQEGVREPVTLTIVLVDDATIHDLNRRFLDHDEPTDVITFALDGDDPAGDFVLPGDAVPRQLGEIYISCERAAAQSAEWSSDPTREVRFLAIHGVLHLLGWDDATPEERARMLARQETILDARPAPGTVAR